MAEPEHPQHNPAIVTGAVIGVLIAAVFCWLFAALASLSVTTGAVVFSFVLLAGWTVFAALTYGGSDAADGSAQAH